MTTKMIIRAVSEEQRVGWTSLADVRKAGFNDGEILEMVQRYQDAQKHAIAYRERAKVKATLMKNRLAELEALAEAKAL